MSIADMFFFKPRRTKVSDNRYLQSPITSKAIFCIHKWTSDRFRLALDLTGHRDLISAVCSSKTISGQSCVLVRAAWSGSSLFARAAWSGSALFAYGNTICLILN